MDTSASGSKPNLERSASKTRRSKSGGTSEGVPPPKNTVRSGHSFASPAAAVDGANGVFSISRHTRSTYASMPCRTASLSTASPTTEMAKSQ